MKQIRLSFGYCSERPHGNWEEKKKNSLRKRQINCVRNICRVLDEREVPRTFFILGNYLERCLDDFSREELMKIYDKDNPLNEIQQHSYSHVIVDNIKTRGDRKSIPVKEFVSDLEKANKVIEDILNITPSGIMLPLGYSHDLSHMPELVKRLNGIGFNYVSSNLRGLDDSLECQLTIGRQPHTYRKIGYADIVEIPTHGWQDVVFTAEKSQKFFERQVDAKETFEYYNNLLDRSMSIAKEDKPFYISLCLHPHAIVEYDPELKIHKKLIDSARNKKIELVSYGEIAKEIII